MKIKKMFITFSCLFLICSITSCTKGNKSVAGNNYAENNYLDGKIYANKSIRELLRLTKDQSIEYAGKYIDDTGALNIELVYNSAKGIERKKLLEHIDSVNNEGKIRFQDAQFSYTELKNAYDILNSKMESLKNEGVVAVGVFEDKNRVKVTVLKLNDKIKKQISEIVDMRLIEIEEGGPIVTT